MTTPDLLRHIAALLESLPSPDLLSINLIPGNSGAELHVSRRDMGPAWRELVVGPVTVQRTPTAIHARWSRDGLRWVVLLGLDQAGELEGFALQTYDGRPLMLRPRLGIVEAA